MFCKNCGNELKEGVKFCSKCGTKLVVASEIEETNSSSNINSNVTGQSQIQVLRWSTWTNSYYCFAVVLYNYVFYWRYY